MAARGAGAAGVVALAMLIFSITSATNWRGWPPRIGQSLYLLPCEDRFRNHPVNALSAIDDLRHMIVGGHARDHVGLLTREVRESLGDEIDRFAHRDLHRLVQIGIESHHDPVRGGLCARPEESQILAHYELELAA